MRCPTCSTEVPEARFCARCGDRLADASAPDPATRHLVRTGVQEVSTSGWAGVAAAMAAGLLVVVGASAAAGWMTGDDAIEGREVALPTATSDPATAGAEPAAVPDAAASSLAAAPSATVLCSNFAEHRIEQARLDGAEVGAVVEVHGGPCVVTEVDAEADTRDYPRGVARGNRPGTGPTPRR